MCNVTMRKAIYDINMLDNAIYLHLVRDNKVNTLSCIRLAISDRPNLLKFAASLDAAPSLATQRATI